MLGAEREKFLDFIKNRTVSVFKISIVTLRRFATGYVFLGGTGQLIRGLALFDRGNYPIGDG